jgi:hypothetical protein
VVQQHPVVQHLVAVVQLFQIHVLGQVIALGLQLLPDPLGLPLQGQHPGRQPPGQAQRVPLSQRERHPAVVQGVVQHDRFCRRAHAVVALDVLVHFDEPLHSSLLDSRDAIPDAALSIEMRSEVMASEDSLFLLLLMMVSFRQPLVA